MAHSDSPDGRRKGTSLVFLSRAEILGRLRQLEKSIVQSPIGYGFIIEPYQIEQLLLDYRCPRCKAITHYLPFAGGKGVLTGPKGSPEINADRQPPLAFNDLPVYRKAVYAARSFGIPIRFLETPLCARCSGSTTTTSSPYYEVFFEESRTVSIPEEDLDPFDLKSIVSLLWGSEYTGSLCDGKELRSRVNHFIDLLEAAR